MSQIRNIIVSFIALVILYLFVRAANSIGAPSIFTLVGVIMVLLILWNVAKRLIRGF